MTTDAAIRLAVYRHFASTGTAPTPSALANEFSLQPLDVERALLRLQDEADALVLLPGSRYVWMAEPFSAVPTDYVVRGQNGVTWHGNCIWDALAILALLEVDGSVETACAASGEPLVVTVAGGALKTAAGVAHFAVPAGDWWRSIGDT